MFACVCVIVLACGECSVLEQDEGICADSAHWVAVVVVFVCAVVVGVVSAVLLNVLVAEGVWEPESVVVAVLEESGSYTKSSYTPSRDQLSFHFCLHLAITTSSSKEVWGGAPTRRFPGRSIE